MAIKRYIKRIRVTEEILVICESGSTQPRLIEQDARKLHRRPVETTKVEEVLDDWREMTPLELTLVGVTESVSRSTMFDR